jgi:hypothetical protein
VQWALRAIGLAFDVSQDTVDYHMALLMGPRYMRVTGPLTVHVNLDDGRRDQ